MRLVFYVIAAPEGGLTDKHHWILEASVKSLRKFNRNIPVHIHVYGQESAQQIARLLSGFDVDVRALEPFPEILEELCPELAGALSLFPLLGKWMTLSELSNPNPTQALYLDWDTFFLDDVEKLFDTYSERDFYAREEVFCRRSRWGYLPYREGVKEYRATINEKMLARIAQAEGAVPVPPYNLGVVMFNNGSWRKMVTRRDLYLSYASRFARSIGTREDLYFSGPGFEHLAYQNRLRELAARPDAEFDEHSLNYPSGNPWLLEEVSLWLTLGHVDGLTHGDLSSRDVCMGYEFLYRSFKKPRNTLIHYLGGPLTTLFFLWIADHNFRLGATDESGAVIDADRPSFVDLPASGSPFPLKAMGRRWKAKVRLAVLLVFVRVRVSRLSTKVGQLVKSNQV